MLTPEGKVKAQLKRELKKEGIFSYWPVPAGYGKQMVDCIVCERGRFFTIECKREGVDRPTPRQAQIMKEIRAAGGVTYLVTMERGKLKWIEIK